jgi:hypothetical protein
VNSGDGVVKKKKKKEEGRTCGAAGGCWPENGLDDGRSFFLFSVFFLFMLCSSSRSLFYSFSLSLVILLFLR